MGNVTGAAWLTAEIREYNPATAKRALGNRMKNRRISLVRVQRFVQAMTNGEWVIAQPLLFDRKGRLIDGQHRLQAVIASKKTIKFLVVKGYDERKVFAKVDDTGPRTLAAALEIEGEQLPDVLATVIKMAHKDASGRIPTASGGGFIQTPIEGVDFLAAFPKIRESVMKAPATVSPLAPRSMLCFCHYKFAQKSRAEADNFLLELAIGEPEDGDPIYLLREILKANAARKGEKLTKQHQLALIYKAWNAVRRGEKTARLSWRDSKHKDEKFPKVA
jgi:hypothetical protein